MTTTRSRLLPRVAAAHPRCFWLDGGGAREWSGRRSMVGWLDDDDVSLTYDAARGEVTRHAAGRVEVVGDDVFAALEAELAARRTRTTSGSATSATPPRPDLPRRPRRPTCPTRSGCGRAHSGSSTTPTAGSVDVVTISALERRDR